MAVVRLEGDGGVLVIGAEDWCSVAFEREGESIQLGAEAFGVLAGRILAALSGLPQEPSGTIEGESVSWVATLAEKHASLYAANHGDGRRFFVEDAHGRHVGALIVSTDTAKGWAARLQGELEAREGS